MIKFLENPVEFQLKKALTPAIGIREIIIQNMENNEN
jgi:hypothetical protein